MHNYHTETAPQCIEVPRETLTERLQRERTNLMERVNEIDAVLAALQQNPQVQSVLDLLQKTRCL